ncbi:MAG: hypothetical protein OXP08_09280 [bacterium]|nr:hypothetical protein [bacterium]
MEAIIASLVGLSGLLIAGSITWMRIDMNQRFDKIDERFQRVDQRFDKIDERFQRVDERFQRVDQRFDEVVTVIGGQGERIARLEGRDPAAAAATEESAA